jgi:hypothetical protein
MANVLALSLKNKRKQRRENGKTITRLRNMMTFDEQDKVIRFMKNIIRTR